MMSLIHKIRLNGAYFFDIYENCCKQTWIVCVSALKSQNPTQPTTTLLHRSYITTLHSVILGCGSSSNSSSFVVLNWQLMNCLDHVYQIWCDACCYKRESIVCLYCLDFHWCCRNVSFLIMVTMESLAWYVHESRKIGVIIDNLW